MAPTLIVYRPPIVPEKICALNQEQIRYLVTNCKIADMESVNKILFGSYKLIIIRNRFYYETKYKKGEFFRCPNGGSYIIFIDQNQVRVICTIHGERRYPGWDETVNIKSILKCNN